eukprot:1160665-Pelagomonas_calceolata.AAC.9
MGQYQWVSTKGPVPKSQCQWVNTSGPVPKDQCQKVSANGSIPVGQYQRTSANESVPLGRNRWVNTNGPAPVDSTDGPMTMCLYQWVSTNGSVRTVQFQAFRHPQRVSTSACSFVAQAHLSPLHTPSKTILLHCKARAACRTSSI